MIPTDCYMPGIPRSIAERPDMATVERIRGSIGEDNGQTLRSSMLKPCPFCGEAEPFVQTHELGDCSIGARVVCPRCHVATSSEYMSSRMTYLPTGEDITRLLAIGKAISSWNRRAE